MDSSTGKICAPMQVGEIWVNSTANYDGVAGIEPALQRKFFGRINTDFPGETFARSGDIGFLYSQREPPSPSSSGDSQNEASPSSLFVLVSRADVVEQHGLRYYVQDVESTAEKAHASIVHNGS